ncbi:MAG: HD domain-containing protein [Candidatus Glassbacteria bacterium]
MPRQLREYEPGENVDTVCILAGLAVKQTRQNKPFLRLELGDSSGRVAAVMWDGFDDEVVRTPVGTVLRVRGRMDSYEDRPQVVVTSISVPAPGSYDPGLLLPSSERDVDRMLVELDERVKSVGYAPLRRLLEEMFSAGSLRESFARAPAAKRWHQPYLGGLLEHTLNVCYHANLIAGRYPQVNLDMVIAGSLVHDLGKTVEYNWESFFDTSTQGRLLGHLVIGVEILGEWIGRQKEFPEPLGWHLKHIILSHHGALEFGSPVVPRTVEALVVHFADDLDSKMSGVLRIYDREQEAPGDWTSYVKLMEREFFKSPAIPLDPSAENSPGASSVKPGRAGAKPRLEQSLFDRDNLS